MPPIIVAIALSTALCLTYMVRSLIRKPDNHALRAACLAMLAMLVAIGLGLVASGAQADNPIRVSNWWVSVVQHVFTMTSLYFAMVFFLHSVHPRSTATAKARRHGVGLLISSAAAVVFAAFASPADYSAAFMAEYAAAPFSSLYLIVYAGYLMLMVLTITMLSWRWSRLADDLWIRRGMLVGAVGDSVGVAYCAVKITYLVIARADITPSVREMTVTGPLILICVPLAFIGLTVPGWGPRLTALNRWASRYRARRQLHPLWSALTAQFPHVRMSLDRSWLSRLLDRLFGDRPGIRRLSMAWDEKWAPHPRDLDLRLHLQVVQIWDARRALIGHCDPAVYQGELRRGGEQGSSGDALAARAEAVMLTTALRRHRRDEPVVSGDKSQIPVGTDAADLAANVAWLRRISSAFRGRRSVLDAE